MSGSIRKLGKLPKPNNEVEIVGAKMPREDKEPTIYDSRSARTRAREITVEDTKGDKIVVKTHTRTRPKGDK